MRALLDRARQRLFRWRSDGDATIVLSRRRIFILPSRFGFAFALLLLIMLLGAINYQLALAHALVFLLAGIALVGMVHAFRNLFGLSVQPLGAAPVHAGDTALFRLRLDNLCDTSRPDLKLQVSGESPVDCHLPAHASCEAAVPVTAAMRGWLSLPRVRLSSRYPLGLYEAWSYLQPAMRCLVYPAPLERPLPGPVAEGQGEAAGHGGAEDFSGFRNRQPADSPRHVAWKASARDDGQRPLLIKLFADGGSDLLSLDWSATAELGDTETRLSVLCGWVLAAEAAGASYALHLPGRQRPYGHGEAHQRACLEMLALHAP